MAVLKKKLFPRGGHIEKPTEQDADSKDNGIVFGAVQLKPKKKSKKHTKPSSGGDNDVVEAFSAELLNYNTIQDGMNIMGIVCEANQLNLKISLPGRMIANVNVLEISNSYTRVTKEFVSDPENTENYKALPELYREGQMVYGHVKQLKRSKTGRLNIKMSLKPSEVHGELLHASIKKGFIFNGAIEEVQEHGYVIETGISSGRAFLPFEHSQKGYAVGQLVYMKVRDVKHDKAASTFVCKEIDMHKLNVKKQLDPNIDYILPTTIVKFQVKKQLKDGLRGNILGDTFTAYVNEHQLAEPLALPEDYEIDSVWNARILYIMPLTKIVYLTLNLRKQKEEDENGDEDEEDKPESGAEDTKLKRGDIVEDARVIHLGTGGVVLVLNNKYKGVISYRTIKANYKGNYDQDELLVKYAKKTKHTVRVLSYDLMDSMYICTDDASTVNEKMFALDDLQPGEFVNGVVKGPNKGIHGYNLQLGKLKGTIEKIFLAPSTKPLEPNSKVRCRVIAIDRERKLVYLTNRAEYLSKTCKVLSSVEEAKVNGHFTGTVVHCEENYVLIKFFNHLKGMLYRTQLSGFMAPEISSFYPGQTMQFRIVSRDEEKIVLGLIDYMFEMGEIHPANVVNKLESGLEINVRMQAEYNDDEELVECKGLIPLRLLSNYTDLLNAKKHACALGSTVEVACLFKNTFSLRDVDYFRQNPIKQWQTVRLGDVMRAWVKNVEVDVVEVLLPIVDYHKLVRIHLNMIVASGRNTNNITLVPEQVLMVKIIGIELATRSLTVSAKLGDVWNGQMASTAGYVEDYLDEVAAVKRAFGEQGEPIAQYSLGDKISAQFQCVHAETKDWIYRVPKTNLLAVVRPSIYGRSEPPAVDTKQDCIVLWIDYSNQLLFVSNRRADIEHIDNSVALPQHYGNAGINAKVLLKLDNIFVCSLKKGQYPLVFCPIRLHYNDFERTASSGVDEADFCKLTIIHNARPIAVLDETFKAARSAEKKRKTQVELEALVPKKKAKVDDASLPMRPEKQLPKKELKERLPFFEDKTKVVPAPPSVSVAKKARPAAGAVLPGVADFWKTSLAQLNADQADTESSEEEVDEDGEEGAASDAKKRKKLTAAEKFKQQRAEEERLRAIEERYADPNQLPETVDQFDRLVLSDPNNSKHWISYMVFHLQSAEIDKARAVARRAIKSISFRNSDEQMNIWVALLNLELRYGSKESYEEVLKESLTCNDPLKIYLRLLEILKDAKRTPELLNVIGTVMKKYRTDKEVWRAVASAYFAIGMVDRAQTMLNKALTNLPEREHVNTIVMFANLNHKYGHNEMAQTLLDQVVTAYPKRVDVWTQYVDLLVKVELIESARSVLERAIVQKIPLKKMRTIFKKYLEFEERFGTDVEVQKVKQLAVAYVKSNSHL